MNLKEIFTHCKKFYILQCIDLISFLNFINFYTHRSVTVKTDMYYSACTYRVSEFHVASGVKIQRIVH